MPLFPVSFLPDFSFVQFSYDSHVFRLLDLTSLLHLSMRHFVKAVLSAHDTVAQKNFDPVLPPLPDDVDDDLEEESVKIVRLVKNKEPLVSAMTK